MSRYGFCSICGVATHRAPTWRVRPTADTQGKVCRRHLPDCYWLYIATNCVGEPRVQGSTTRPALLPSREENEESMTINDTRDLQTLLANHESRLNLIEYEMAALYFGA